jgi:pimeloyl-ACP methyl ester carboxylesterase
VDDAVRFVAEQIARPTIIVGHSLGAMVAAGVASKIPELVTMVILEDPPFHTMGNRILGTAWQALFRGMQRERFAVTTSTSLDDLAQQLAAIELPAEGLVRRLGDLRDSESLEWSAACLLDMDPEVLTPVIAGLWLDNYDLDGVFTRVDCPVLLLQADPTSGGALADLDVNKIRGWLKRGVHLQLPKASHQIHRERSEEMLGAIERFLPTAALL